MIVGIILIVVSLIILSPVMIILIKGLCNAIYSAWRYDEIDEIYGLAVVAGSFILAAGIVCCIKFSKPIEQQTQKETTYDQIGSQEAQSQ